MRASAVPPLSDEGIGFLYREYNLAKKANRFVPLVYPCPSGEKIPLLENSWEVLEDSCKISQEGALFLRILAIFVQIMDILRDSC